MKLTSVFLLFIFTLVCIPSIKASDDSLQSSLDYSQRNLLKKIAVFLKKEEDRFSSSVDAYKLATIEKAKPEGQCSGLTILWGYGKRISDEPIRLGHEARDDNHFFRHIQRLLLTKLPENFTLPERRDVERFISNVNLFQGQAIAIFKDEGSITSHKKSIACNINLIQTFEDTTGRQFVELLGLDQFVCDKSIFHDRLQKIMRPSVLIFITRNGELIRKKELLTENGLPLPDTNYFDWSNPELIPLVNESVAFF